MASNFQPNSAAFRAMAVGPEVRAAVDSEAKRAEATAKAIAEDFRVTGDYEDGFDVFVDTVKLKTAFGQHDVAAGVLINRAVDAKGKPYAAAVEWGNKHDHLAHHVLGRTVAQLADD
jgi:hypothetical protein